LWSELRRVAASEDELSSCHLQSYVPESDLVLLLGGALFLCFPSLSEGFGLPVLDAFACHTAVLTSRETSIPEVAGEAALYVDPHCANSIAQGIQTLLSDRDLREDLVARGQERLPQFSWQGCVETFCATIERFG